MRAAAHHKCVRDEKICIADASSKQMEITGRMQNALSGKAHAHESAFTSVATCSKVAWADGFFRLAYHRQSAYY